jgi:hypothetical protein
MRRQSKVHVCQGAAACIWLATISVAAGLTTIQTGAASPALDADIVLNPAGAGLPPGLTVGLFAPDTTIKSAVEGLKPEQSWPVAAFRVALNANTGLCADHTIARILELPNQAKDQANPDGPECIFGALLSIEAGPRKFEIATECGDWVDNAALCWGYGQTGEFRLIRDKPAGSATFKLVFPGPVAKAAAPASGGNSEDPAAQKHGLFLDTLVDDTKENKGDLWLTWTSTTVEITFLR